MVTGMSICGGCRDREQQLWDLVADEGLPYEELPATPACQQVSEICRPAQVA